MAHGKDRHTYHGRIIFIFAAAVVCLTVGFSSMRNGDYAHIFILLFALVFGAIGFLDDWEKLRKKQNLGLSAKAKFLLQLVAALVFVLLMRKLGYLSTHLYIPFWNVEVPIPDAVYFILAAFIIVGTVNAVNITDGVDGLASGTSIPVFFFYTVVAFLWGERYLSLGIFSSAMLGGSSPRPSRAVCWAFSSTTSTPPRCSWVTPARCF